MTANKKDTAQKIIEAAAEEFAGHGLAGARIDRIAKLAGVNKAMIYYHFKSKDELYQTIIDRHLNKISNFFRERVALLDNPDEIFRTLSEFYNSQFIDKNFIPILLREIASGGDIIKKSFGDFLSKGPVMKLKGVIEEAARTGAFRPVNSRQAIASFIGMNLFYLFMSPMVNQILEIEDEKEFREKRPDAVFDLFFYGIKAK